MLMQLHSTGWLGQKWGKSDIFFMKSNGPTHRNPFVRRSFGSSNTSNPYNDSRTSSISGTELGVVHRVDPSLFSLGIVLIELFFWKPIEVLAIELRGQAEAGVDSLDVDADLETAKRYIGEIIAKAGFDYGLAVSRCIIGLELANESLEDNNFKNEVHANIVCPLEKHAEVVP